MKWFHALGIADGFLQGSLTVKLGVAVTTLNTNDVILLRDHLNKILEDAPSAP